MANKVGPLIKEARTNAGLTQEALAKQLEDITASDISKAERGEKELTQSVLKQIAKITGVTQASLVNAAKESTYTGSTKTAQKKTTSSKSTSSKTTSSKSSSKSSGTSMTLTATEKKLVELYRAADSDTKKSAISILKGETPETADVITSLLGSAIDAFTKK